jgi:hypothetical protein
MRYGSDVVLARAPICLSIPNAKSGASIRDTRARGADRFCWSAWPRTSHTLSRPGTIRIAGGHWLAETALRAFIDD